MQFSHESGSSRSSSNTYYSTEVRRLSVARLCRDKTKVVLEKYDDQEAVAEDLMWQELGRQSSRL